MNPKKVSIYAEMIKDRANNIMLGATLVETEGLHLEDTRYLKNEVSIIKRYLEVIEQEIETIK